jgi:predicted DNA-binding protein YlxM (UPF0122 family)
MRKTKKELESIICDYYINQLDIKVLADIHGLSTANIRNIVQLKTNKKHTISYYKSLPITHSKQPNMRCIEAKVSIKDFTEDEKDKIIKNFINGTSLAQLSNEHKTHIATIKSILANNKLYVRNLTEDEKNIIKNKYKNGKTITELSRQYHVNKSSISHLVKPKPKNKKRTADDLTNEEIKQLITEFDNNILRISFIKSKYNINKSTILELTKKKPTFKRKSIKQMTPDELIDIINSYYIDNLSLATLATKYNTHRTTIMRVVKFQTKQSITLPHYNSLNLALEAL